ncbi:peptidylprolyl isomerase [Luteipulveratus halotolerans]|uniref:Peptidyl-prolyl cis-trans isomerase n=1 Tax=Luteipulveratus halotolerans TaxID=1631356 RepID=A0A0L6CNE6_9MICO|nr:peptidylprolyl isomerase [Luteipulveratus halotolerans]
MGAALLSLSVTSCGEESASGTSTASSSVAATSSAPVTPAAAPCSKPPALPSSVPTFSAAPDKADAAGKTFVATVHTTCGDIVLELDGAKAPQTVASFRQLAEKAYWKDSPCHRLTTDGIYVLQCGDPTGSGSGNPGYGYGIENAPADGAYPAGSLAMARTQDPNSNGGQFFVVYEDSTIDPSTGGYSIFGHVTKGMDILAKIAKAGVSGGGADGPPAQPISILSVAVTEKKA